MHAAQRYVGFVILLFAVVAGATTLRRQQPGPAMSAAATAFLGSLSEEQRAQATLDFDDPSRVDWHFIPKPNRKGVQIKEMNAAQRQQAHGLLRAALSQIGYDKADTIMSLEAILRELEGEGSRFARDPQRYYFTIFGEPGDTQRWGLSIEGHHLSLNFVVDGGRVVSHTPAFFGANPALVTVDSKSGPPRGTRVLADEELLAFRLLDSLSEEQRAAALIADKAPRELQAAGQPQPPETPPAGIVAKQLTAEQRDTLRKLVGVYTSNMPETVAAARWSEIEAGGVENIHFAWAGALRGGVGHYYRIQGPSFIVELVNTQPDAAGNPANHVHSVWRNTKGDFAIER